MHAENARLLRTVDPAVLGERLRSARVASGLTQRELGAPEASVAHVSRIEAGARRPGLALLGAMAGRLGTTPRVLLLGASAGEAEEVGLALTFVELALEGGDVAAALERSGIVLERARSVARADLLHRALLAHGRALESNGRLEEAIEVLDDLVGLDGTGLTWARGGIALCRCTREWGDLARAIDTGETVRARLTAAGLDGTDESVQLTVTLASAYHERGDVAFAARLCRDAVRRAETTGSPTARASAYWNASMVVAESGDVSEALPMAERALALLSEGSDSRNVARLRSVLATLQLAGDPPQLDAAEENLVRADAELRSSSASPVDVARNTLSRARVSLLRGDPRDAVDLASLAHGEVEGMAPLLAADALSVQGQALHLLGDPAAVDRYRSAVLVLTGIGADRSAARLWYDLGTLLEASGETAEALDAFRRAAASTGLRGTTVVRATTPADSSAPLPPSAST